MSSNNDFEMLEVVDVGTNGLQVFQQDRAMIDMQIATAKKYPRNLKRVVDNCIAIISLDKEFADDCTYSLKKGGKIIAGPSVYLARLLAQNMGNMRVENRVVGFSDTHVTVEAVCFDLETNYAIRTQIKKSIVGSSGKYTEDMQVITANAANAIALRNAIFNVVPSQIVNKVYAEAKKTIAGDLSDEKKLLLRRTKMFEGLIGTYNVTEAEILKAVGKASVDHITPDDIVALVGFDKAIKEGEMKVDEIFRPEKQQRQPTKNHDVERLVALIKAATKTSELQRLLNVVASYPNECSELYDQKYKELKDKEDAAAKAKPTDQTKTENQ